MKPLAVLAASFVLLTGVTLAVGTRPQSESNASPLSCAPSPAGEAPPPLVVHEWGTFTSFSGSDGVKLEFRPLVDQDLPRFVVGNVPSAILLFIKPNIRAIQRMETPVTYFYTPVERDVSVKVEFPEGLLTEYYPPVRSVGPRRESAGDQKPVWDQVPVASEEVFRNWNSPASAPQGESLKGGMLDWGQVHLIPTSALRARVADEELAQRLGRHIERLMLEPANGFPHYEFARETDSAIVQFRQGDGAAAIDHFEKFLFYRGLGNFELPLTLSETADGTFVLDNRGNEEIRSLFLVSVKGELVRFRRYDRSAPGSRITLRQSKRSSTVDDLAAAMVESLQAEGLYEKEARAMVKCWRSSWFGEEGTRLLYMVPGAITDQLLPLHVDPQPDEVVRVLVGRMEIMPTSQEQQILELVSRSAAAREKTAVDQSQRFQSPVLKQLRSMGRLAEPALVRVRNITNEQSTRAEATRLISELRETQSLHSKTAGTNSAAGG
jgi:hypothetical protein